jgi:hypothetical protein
MGKSAPAPPPAPDYAGAAYQQGQANLQAGQQTASLNNPNIYGPYGNQTVNYTPTGPNGDMQANVYQSLTPDAQAALTAQQRVQAGLGNLGAQGMQQASQILGTPFQYNGPGIQTSIGNYGQASGAMPNYGMAQGSIGDYGQASGNISGYGDITRNIDTSGIAAMPVNAGQTGQAAIMARLNPQIQQQNAANAQNLANQGITMGSEAWNTAMRQQGQQQNDLLSQASLYGLGLDMSANQQGYNQAANNAAFQNQAQQQAYGQAANNAQFGNQAIAQNYQQALANAGFSNQALAQNYQQAANNQQLQNQAVAQNYGQAINNAQFGNQAALQSYQQQLAQYNQPLNQITALMSGSQIQAPQFQQYSGGGQIGAAPIANATAQQGTYNQGIYGQQMAGYNAGMQALGGLFGGAAKMFSPVSLIGSGQSLFG